MKKAVVSLAAALTLCLIGAPALAADSQKASLSADGRITYIAPGAARSAVKRSQLAPEDRTTIVNTFNADPDNAFDCCAGYTVSAVGSIIGAKQTIAMPFTPTEDTHLRKVVVAVGWVVGVNHVTLSLLEDAGGMPGDAIKRDQEDGLPTFGSCCEVTAVPSKPIPLKAGVQYWIAARATSDTWAAWNWSNTGASGTFAYNPGGGWQLAEGTLVAYAVYGN
jgi:hypothetical protein